MDATRQRILPHASHTREDRATAYRAMHFAAELLHAAGASAVLDAPYGHPEDRAVLKRISNGSYRLIECRVAPEVAVARLKARGLPDPTRPDLTEDLVEHLHREYPYSHEGLLLDTNRLSFEECLARIDAFLAG